jgi:hypothetical protein
MLDDATLDPTLEATLHPAANGWWSHQRNGRSNLAKYQDQQQACTQRFEHNTGMLGAFESRVKCLTPLKKQAKKLELHTA